MFYAASFHLPFLRDTNTTVLHYLALWPDHAQTAKCRVLSVEFKLKLDLEGWRRWWHPTPVLLPGKSHGWRSLVGCSPWGREESDMTEQLHFHFLLSCIGEGNGNPLQCSCLENPRDGGAWWAAVYGVPQSRTRLKWLSSSSRPGGHLSMARGTHCPMWLGPTLDFC